MRIRRIGEVAFIAVAAVAVLAGHNAIAAGGGGGLMWATGQDGGKLYVVRGNGSETTITDPMMVAPHLIRFSPSGRYAYVADVSNGRLNVFRTSSHELAASLTFPSAGNDTHQAKPSPDGTVLLVTRRIPARTLHKVLADENAETWAVTPQQINFAPLGKTPICSVFRADGQRAYVTLAPSGIATVDVPTMTLLGITETVGITPCGLAESKDDRTVYAAASTGNLYRLDKETGAIALHRVVPGAVDMHYAALSEDEKAVFVSSRGNDRLFRVEIEGTGIESVELGTAGVVDAPDGVAVVGNNVYVTLKNTGTLAVVHGIRLTANYLELAPPSTNALPHLEVRH